MVDRSLLPSVGINVFLVLFMESNLVVSMRSARRVNNPGIMATTGQHKSYIGVSQHLNFINRAPRCHMVRNRADREGGIPNIAQRRRAVIAFIGGRSL